LLKTDQISICKNPLSLKSIHIDIIHPANVHYFKHAIANWKAMGFEIIITCRNKEITYELLDLEGLAYTPMGKNPKSVLGKFLFLFKCEWNIFKLYLKKKPDIALSFAASYVAHMASLFGLPHVSFDDTEHAKLNRRLYLPFTDLVLNPESYLLDLGKKQFKFKGHMELFYLNKKYFHPDKKIFSELGIKENERFVFLRFVSWGAFHDQGQMGFSDAYKIELAKKLSLDFQVFISSEGVLPPELLPFKIKIKPDRVHHVLYFADLFVGEGATMASECAALGTPAIYVNSLDAGTLQRQAADGLIINKRYQDGTLEKAHEILNDEKTKIRLKEKVKLLDQERYNLTDFLTWLVAEYPESKQKLLSGKIDPKTKF
jgi:predicted glycosyltransferase